MPVWFSNVDRHKSHCRLNKCMERSSNCAGELDAANSSAQLCIASSVWGAGDGGNSSGMAGSAVSGYMRCQ